jgi:hypothetical protein
MHENPGFDRIFDCNVAVLVYDGGAESVNYLKTEVISRLPKILPKVLVLNKIGNQDLIIHNIASELEANSASNVQLHKRRPDYLFRQIREVSLSNERAKEDSSEASSLGLSSSTKLALSALVLGGTYLVARRNLSFLKSLIFIK